jgi:hypothetical protein
MRVSATSLSRASAINDQIAALEGAGATRVFAEKLSGARSDPPQLRKALDALGAGLDRAYSGSGPIFLGACITKKRAPAAKHRGLGSSRGLRRRCSHSLDADRCYPRSRSRGPSTNRSGQPRRVSPRIARRGASGRSHAVPKTPHPRGRLTPTLLTLKRLAKILQVTPRSLH